MSHILLFFKDNSVLVNIFISILSVILGSGGTLWISRKNYKLAKEKLEKDNAITQAKIEADKKALRQQMITNNIAPMRQKWINDLRSTSSQFISEAIFITTFDAYKKGKENKKYKRKNNDIEKKFDEIKMSIIRTVTYLDLLLPVADKEEEARKIRKIMTDLILRKENYTAEEINQKVFDMKKQLRFLLKKEWEVTKSLKEIE